MCIKVPNYHWYWSGYCPCCGRSKAKPIIIEREIVKEIVTEKIRYVPAKRWR